MQAIYNEVGLVSESLAYHMATNCFLMPEEGMSEEGKPNGSNPTSKRGEIEQEHDSESGWDLVGKFQDYWKNKKQRIDDFCDNLGLTLRGKFFVTKVNLSHYLSLIRRQASRISTQNQPTRIEEDGRQADSPLGEMGGPSSIGADGAAQTSKQIHFNRSFNKLPKSSKSLGRQKAKILSRLAKLKENSRFNIGGRHLKTTQKRLCVVCYDNAPNIVTLPCEHHEICLDCFIEIIYMAIKRSRYPLRCVLCREKVEKIRCTKSVLLNMIEKNRTTTAKS